MREDTFVKFWDIWSKEWHSHDVVWDMGQKIKVSDLCSLNPNYGSQLHKIYEAIKNSVKGMYFKNMEKRLSRYKRAAVIAYAINRSAPLTFKETEDSLDRFFLKQRLAFYVAMGSIIVDYKEEDVKKFDKIFLFSELGKDATSEEDSFLESVYKDLFFSDIYRNYNVLTMANVFGLLTERASRLSELSPIADETHTDD